MEKIKYSAAPSSKDEEKKKTPDKRKITATKMDTSRVTVTLVLAINLISIAAKVNLKTIRIGLI